MAGMFVWNTSRPLVMGILNVTPDSFSDGGRFMELDQAVAHGHAMLAAGADIIDVGGESTRPGAIPVNADDEIARVVPVIRALAASGAVLSVDTTKAAVAEQAVAAGARIINDISAGRFDSRLRDVARVAGTGLVLMHLQGTPQTMQDAPHYDDVVTEVRTFLAERVAWAEAGGIERAQIAVDPGFGFGKTVAHNLALLARLRELTIPGCALLVGASRKSFIGRTLQREVHGRLAGSLGVAAWALMHGANVVRVHDVAETVDVVRMLAAIQRAG